MLVWLLEAVYRPQEALRPQRGQPVALQVQAHQREGCAEPLMVLPDAPVAHLGESENLLEDAKRMFDFGSHAGLGMTAIINPERQD